MKVAVECTRLGVVGHLARLGSWISKPEYILLL
jgi:hypothetical protein